MRATIADRLEGEAISAPGPLTCRALTAIRSEWSGTSKGHDRAATMAPVETEKETGMRSLILAGVLVIASTAASLAQDATAGEASFKKWCMPCHDIGEGAKIKLGPPLNGIDGRKAGTFPGFNYSDANKSSGITWNEAEFKEYIKSPMTKVPGTRMAFAGVKDEKEVGDLWAYVSSFKADGSKK
jgi:cytochrome c